MALWLTEYSCICSSNHWRYANIIYQGAYGRVPFHPIPVMVPFLHWPHSVWTSEAQFLTPLQAKLASGTPVSQPNFDCLSDFIANTHDGVISSLWHYSHFQSSNPSNFLRNNPFYPRTTFHRTRWNSHIPWATRDLMIYIETDVRHEFDACARKMLVYHCALSGRNCCPSNILPLLMSDNLLLHWSTAVWATFLAKSPVLHI